MLEPHNRILMLEVLRPPLDYDLDYAIGTTYSLDLLALLSVPLSFSRFDWESSSGEPIREPYALLEALRRHCDRLTVFCQGGAIYQPTHVNQLFTHIEKSVVQVSAPKGGIFHPKVWILRFRNDKEDVLYRVVCLSRNLTFDNSWDTSVVLEGHLASRQNSFSANRPLADFVASLPMLARKGSLDKARKDSVLEISDELLRVPFELPEGITSYRFWPLGIDHHSKSPLEGRQDRLLVVSPFVDDGFMAGLEVPRAGVSLVSRIEALNALDPKSLPKKKEVYVLSDAAQPEPEDTDEDMAKIDNRLEGLHAKLYMVEKGWNAHIYSGSANATSAAFERNVEFLVELGGAKSRWGIDPFMLKGEKGRTTFADMLSNYAPPPLIEKIDQVSKQLELIVEKAIRAISEEDLLAVVSPSGKDQEWVVRIQTKSKKGLEFPPEIRRVICWPICVNEALAVEAEGNKELVAAFEGISTNALTTFFAFKVSAELKEKSVEMTRVVTIPLEGGPQDRRERVLLGMLQDKEQFLKFLFFILSDGEGIPIFPEDEKQKGDGLGFEWKWVGNDSLFESLVRALHSNPRRLDEVAKVIADLKNAPNGLSILPEGFQEIWEPICHAREGVK